MQTITFNVNKKKIHIHLCLDYSRTNKKQEMISELTKDITAAKLLGRVGKEAVAFLTHILCAISKNKKNYPVYNFNKKEIIHLIKNQIKECNKLLPTKSLNLFIFPSYSRFVKNKMNGTSGQSVWKNTIHIGINPTAKHWKRGLRTTLSHEYIHAIANVYSGTISGRDCTLLEGIISEGLAENLVKQLRLKPLKIMPAAECKKILNKVKSKLNSKSAAIYDNLFYNNKEFPTWTGYAVGHCIVKHFIKKHSQLKWPQLIRVRPERVLKEFLSS